MAQKYEKKDIEFKFTLSGDDAEAGTFTGYASIFDMVDSDGESVMRGAFKKTLKEKKDFPMCWSHDIFEPLGVISGIEDEKGLVVTGKLNMDVQRGREIRSLMAQGAVKGLSIGYNVVKEAIDRENAVRQLKELNLWEISPCVFQACPGALVNEVKSKLAHLREDIERIDVEDISDELKSEIELFNESLIALQGKAEPPAGTPEENHAEEPPADSDAVELRVVKDWRDFLAALS